MRNKNVVKYRKLLQELQNYCKNKKSETQTHFNGTDFQRGKAEGKHSAYNDVLKKVSDMIRDAEFDWDCMECREDSEKETLF